MPKGTISSAMLKRKAFPALIHQKYFLHPACGPFQKFENSKCAQTDRQTDRQDANTIVCSSGQITQAKKTEEDYSL